MDALLLAFFLSCIAESGGKQPELFRVLHARYRGGIAVLAGAILALAVNAGIAAWAGGMIGAMLTPEARTLFLALALAAAGIGLFLAGRPPDPLERWRAGPFLTSLGGLFILGFGESGSFLVAGIAASRADPWMAGAGGFLGGLAACLGPLAAGAAMPDRARKIIRSGAAVILLLIAFAIATSALRLA